MHVLKFCFICDMLLRPPCKHLYLCSRCDTMSQPSPSFLCFLTINCIHTAFIPTRQQLIYKSWCWFEEGYGCLYKNNVDIQVRIFSFSCYQSYGQFFLSSFTNFNAFYGLWNFYGNVDILVWVASSIHVTLIIIVIPDLKCYPMFV